MIPILVEAKKSFLKSGHTPGYTNQYKKEFSFLFSPLFILFTIYSEFLVFIVYNLDYSIFI